MAKRPIRLSQDDHAVALGDVYGQDYFRRHGYLPTVDATEAVIQCLVGKPQPWLPLVAQPIEIVSTSGADALGGLGAQVVCVHGLDANWNEQQEQVSMLGTTPVETTLSFLRVDYILVIEVGTYRGSNIGNITASESESPADTVIRMLAGNGLCQSTHYSVPAGHTLLVHEYGVSSDASKIMTVKMYVATGSDTTVPYVGARTAQLILEASGSISGESGFTVPFPVPEYTDLWATARITTGTGAVSFAYSGILQQLQP